METTTNKENTSGTTASWYAGSRPRPKNETRPMRLAIKPQFEFDKLYFPPFKRRRVYNSDGTVTYVPFERNLQPTGLKVMDDYLVLLGEGRGSMSAYARSLGVLPEDMDSLFFLLTGMHAMDFRLAWQMRMAIHLLRYTSLPIDQVAARSGFGTRMNLYYACRRDQKMSPTELRDSLRKRLDVDKFRVD